MTTRQTHSWLLKGAAAVLAAEVFVCVPLYVNAASSNAKASVRIEYLPATISTISVFSVVIPVAPPASASTSVAAPTAVNQELTSLIGETATAIQPAVFSISGQPGQTFSISVPQAGTISTGLGNVEISGFTHSAGNTPTIGMDGNFTFSVGANLQLSVAELSLDMGTASGDDPFVPQSTSASEKENDESVLARKLGMPRANPFGMQGIESGFMQVSISYN